MSYANMFMRQARQLSREQEEEEWQRIKQRVLELDPENASLKGGFAWEAAYLENDYERAAVLFSEAVEQDPNDSELVRLASTFAARIGRFDQAIRLGRHAVAIDPLCYMCVYHLSRAFMYAGRYDESRENRERYLALGSGGQVHNALLYLLQEQPQAAYDYLLTAEVPAPETLDFWTHEGYKAMALFDLGRTDEAETMLARFVDKAEEFEDFLMVAIPAGWMGKNDLAFEYLFRHAEAEDGSNLNIFSPDFIRLRDDPRWTEYRAAVDLTEERLGALEFNPVLPE